MLRRCDAAVILRAADLCLAFTCSGFGLCVFKAAFLCICVCCCVSEAKVSSARSWAEMQLQRPDFPSLQAPRPLARPAGLSQARVQGAALIALARHLARLDRFCTSAEKPPGFEPQLNWRPRGSGPRKSGSATAALLLLPICLTSPKQPQVAAGGRKWPRDSPLTNLPTRQGCLRFVLSGCKFRYSLVG